MDKNDLIGKLNNLKHADVVRVKLSKEKGNPSERDYFVRTESIGNFPVFYPYNIRESRIINPDPSFHPVPQSEFIESITLIGKCELMLPNLYDRFVRYEFRELPQKTL